MVSSCVEMLSLSDGVEFSVSKHHALDWLILNMEQRCDDQSWKQVVPNLHLFAALPCTYKSKLYIQIAWNPVSL